MGNGMGSLLEQMLVLVLVHWTAGQATAQYACTHPWQAVRNIRARTGASSGFARRTDLDG
jgi:hypothetical protein